MRQLSGPLARATVYTSGVLMARLFVQAATLLVLARLLGPTQFAALASLTGLAVFLGAFATFGTQFAVIRDLTQDAARRDTLLPAVLGTTCACGLVLLSVYYCTWRALLSALPIGLTTVMCIGIAEVLLQPLLTISAAQRLAAGKVARSQLLRMLPLPLQFAAAAGLWLAKSTDALSWYGFGYFGAAFVALLASLSLAHSQWPAPWRWHLLSRRGWKDNSGFALIALTASGPTELDKTLSSRLLPLEMAGIYSAASRIAGALIIPVSSLMMAALPRLFRDAGEGLPQPRLLRWLLGSSLGYGLVAAAVLWLAAPFISSLFGPAFADLPRVIRWFAAVVPALCMRLAGVNILMTIGRTWVRIGVEAGGLVLLLSCAVIFARGGAVHGLVGAVICAEAAMAVFGWLCILSIYLKSYPVASR